MDQVVKVDEQSFIQKWVAEIVAVIIFLVLVIYGMHFYDRSRSTDPEQWGQFGDFLGGSVNPIIGFFTILLLSVSLRQNQRALSQANDALTQAKEELTLTRQAVADAADSQRATEAALKEQVDIASHTRDINNAMALYSTLTERYKLAKQDLDVANARNPQGPEADLARNKYYEIGRSRSHMSEIMTREIDRLKHIYIDDGVCN